jgi:Mg-chelatase subunit ChlD
MNMKTKLIASALFVATAATVGFYPAYHSIGATNPPPVNPVVNLPPVNAISNERPLVEVVFVLDTTGSMSGLIQAAKEKIWSIASSIASAQSTPEIRMGLVAYRDRGDAYVTRVTDLSGDLDSVYATLMDFQANGGGDGPESVNQALYDAIHKISWNQDEQAYKVVFLVGDAPPHMDYNDDVKYPQTLATAARKGILVNTVQCGQNTQTTTQWQHIASLGGGNAFQVEQDGNAVAIATPFDEKLAALSRELDETRLYYGNDDAREKQQRKLDAADKLHAGASLASRARRAAFNASASGEGNFLGDSELVDAVASGKVELSRIDRDQLPEPMQAMAPAEQEALIMEKAKRREELKKELTTLADQRSDYLRQKVEEIGGARDSLDHKIFSTVREQAGTKGITYEAAAPSY